MCMHINLAVNYHTDGLRIDLHGLTETGIFTIIQVAQLEM